MKEEFKKRKLEKMKKLSQAESAASKNRYLKKKKQLKIQKDLHLKAMSEATPFVPGKTKGVHIGGRTKAFGRLTSKHLAQQAIMSMAADRVNESMEKSDEEKEEIVGNVEIPAT